MTQIFRHVATWKWGGVNHNSVDPPVYYTPPRVCTEALRPSPFEGDCRNLHSLEELRGALGFTPRVLRLIKHFGGLHKELSSDARVCAVDLMAEVITFPEVAREVREALKGLEAEFYPIWEDFDKKILATPLSEEWVRVKKGWITNPDAQITFRFVDVETIVATFAGTTVEVEYCDQSVSPLSGSLQNVYGVLRLAIDIVDSLAESGYYRIDHQLEEYGEHSDENPGAYSEQSDANKWQAARSKDKRGIHMHVYSRTQRRPYRPHCQVNLNREFDPEEEMDVEPDDFLHSVLEADWAVNNGVYHFLNSKSGRRAFDDTHTQGLEDFFRVGMVRALNQRGQMFKDCILIRDHKTTKRVPQVHTDWMNPINRCIKRSGEDVWVTHVDGRIIDPTNFIDELHHILAQEECLHPDECNQLIDGGAKPGYVGLSKPFHLPSRVHETREMEMETRTLGRPFHVPSNGDEEARTYGGKTFRTPVGTTNVGYFSFDEKLEDIIISDDAQILRIEFEDVDTTHVVRWPAQDQDGWHKVMVGLQVRTRYLKGGDRQYYLQAVVVVDTSSLAAHWSEGRPPFILVDINGERDRELFDNGVQFTGNDSVTSRYCRFFNQWYVRVIGGRKVLLDQTGIMSRR